MEIKKITRKECEPFIIGIHYAHRWPSISYAYGLYEDSELIGVITYGTPPSATLRIGIAGKEYINSVLELNRLVLKYNKKGQASFLIGKSLRRLPKRMFVVSFADTSQGHLGIVYQATNFGYYGLSAKRTDWKIKGKEHLHGQTIADEFRGVKHRAQAMRDKYGDAFYLAPRPRKHRYIIVTGNGKTKRSMALLIKYKKEPYPKAINY